MSKPVSRPRGGCVPMDFQAHFGRSPIGGYLLVFALACANPDPKSNEGSNEPLDSGHGGSDTGADLGPQTPDEWDAYLRAPGPYSIGYVETELSYTPWQAGDLPDAVPGEGERSLRLAWWWPSNAAPGSAPEARYNGGIPSGEAMSGVPLAPNTSFPLMVYSHGHQGYAEAASFLAEHFASHGWVVLALDHTDNTLTDGSYRSTAIYWQRPLDLSAALDHALAGGGPEAVNIDGRIVAVGHSFGGYTLHALGGATYDEALMATCLAEPSDAGYCATFDPLQAERFQEGFLDSRFQALITMAPGDFRLFEAPGFDTISPPIFHMIGGLDPNADNEPIWSALSRTPGDPLDRLHLQLPRVSHNGFTDFANQLYPVEGELDAKEGFDRINPFTLAFALHHTGTPGLETLLDGSRAGDPEAVLVQPTP
jgi:predicted dienelactone hydrolase